MKKYGKIAYIVLILIIFICGFCIYKVSAKNDSEEKIQEKSFEEIKYLENQITNLFNEINNIKFENYTISATNIEETESQSEDSKTKSAQNESQESGSESSGSSQEKQSEGNNQSSGNSEENQSGTEEKKTENKQYQLKEEGILTKNKETNWNQIKNDVEKLYTVLYSTTIDLYQTVEDKEDISKFNKEYDNLIKAAKEENKQETLKELSLLYDYLAKFVDSCPAEEKEKTVIKTKNHIFKAYSVLDNEDWQTISDNVKKAIEEFSNIAKNAGNNENSNIISESKQNISKYNVNKSYIMINELQNAVDLKEKEIFLIKYKNLLEELENV